MYNSDNLEESVQLFSNKINDVLNVMAPLKRIQIRANYAPWISATTKHLIEEKNMLLKSLLRVISNIIGVIISQCQIVLQT